MRREFLTDEAVEDEISRLKTSKFVKLAKKEQAVRYRRRQYMYQLKSLEKRGKQLDADGITMEKLQNMDAETGSGL